MRSTTVISLLVASWALLSQSPAAYAAPVPSNLVSAMEKRCSMGECKIATVRIFPHSSFLMPCLFLVRLPTLTLRPNRGCKAWLTS
ncbi:hypothetical protein BJV77DRAFT_971733 [Russula vinacea]|nr:hypothetical protein BJV77DRAFT_971733 [Russula vinacea]